MNMLIIILSLLGLLLIGFPTIFFLILWLKSYNRTGIIYREVGDNPSHAQRSVKNFKVTMLKGLGQYIKFMFSGNSYPNSKSFGSKNWYYIREGKKNRIGLPFYLQRDNYRPLILDKEAKKLLVSDVDSREFKLRQFVHKQSDYENNMLYLRVVAILVVFVACLAITYALTSYYLTNDIAARFIANAPAPVVVG